MNVLAFDIETVPDVDSARRVYGLAGLDDAGVAKALFQQRMQETGSEFLRLHLHRVVAISVVLRAGEQLKVWSLGTAQSTERELIERFFDGLERYAPTLVSWNGSGFDLPVLHYRALLHGISAPRYWDTGGDDSTFRWNNYLNRFHERHTDLMEVLSAYQGRAAVPLDELAALLGLPGKMGMHGSEVWGRYLAGDRDGIRVYCETDALNTYLIYLRFELVRGRLSGAAYGAECERVRELLAARDEPHWQRFLEGWAELEPAASADGPRAQSPAD